MAMTFDATLKDMGRECPEGFLTAFDRAPAAPVSVLNVELSTVTAAADLVYGLGEPLREIITARPGRGRVNFEYEVVRLWERPAEELLAGDVGVVPLAVLGKLPENLPFEEAIKGVAQRVVERLLHEVAPDRAKKLLTEALLLTGLRIKRDVAENIFRGVQMMEESDTYLMILERGEEKRAKRDILLFGQGRLGPPDELMKAELEAISDLERLDRMVCRAVKAANWREILDTP